MEIVSVSIVIPFRIKDGISIWMQRRESSDELNGFLEFPGGKINPQEKAKDAAIRETFEETGVKLNPDKLKLETTYDYQKLTKTICLNVFSYQDCGEFTEHWFSEPHDYWEQIPPANQKFLPQVLEQIKSSTYVI